MTIQQRKLYGLLHAQTGKWCRNGKNQIRTWQYSRAASKYRVASFMTGDWQVKPIIEKLERVE